MIEKEQLMEQFIQYAKSQFPDDEWTLETTVWTDGDFRYEAYHTVGHVGDAAIRRRIVATPHTVTEELVGVTETQEGRILESEQIEMKL